MTTPEPLSYEQIKAYLAQGLNSQGETRHEMRDRCIAACQDDFGANWESMSSYDKARMIDQRMELDDTIEELLIKHFL